MFVVRTLVLALGTEVPTTNCLLWVIYGHHITSKFWILVKQRSESSTAIAPLNELRIILRMVSEEQAYF